MSAFEYYGTLLAIGASLLLLAYLFKVRRRIIRNAKLRNAQAKAKHPKPLKMASSNVWNEAAEDREGPL